MKNLSPSQVYIMRWNLFNIPAVKAMIDYTDPFTVVGPPNLSNMAFNFGSPVGTLNFVSAGGHFLNTNLNPAALSSPVSWSTSTTNGNPMGSMNTNYFFSLVAGQSITITATAQNICGSSSRSITFIARASFTMFSRQAVQNTLGIEFSPTEYTEALPENIIVYDEKTGKKEKNFDVRDIFKKEKKNAKFAFDVKELSRGVKILHFVYPESGKNDKSPDIIAERINLVN